MKSVQTLPEGSRLVLQLDLQKDKKTALKVNLLAVVILAAVVALGVGLEPLGSVFRADSPALYWGQLAVLLGGFAAYMILHELVHGVFMYALSGGMKPRYGFTGMYAYAASDACFCRRDYILIALAPVVVWGLVLGVLAALADGGWFWVAWMIQAINLSGAAGDLYVTAKLARMPPNLLVRDAGVSMEVFVPGGRGGVHPSDSRKGGCGGERDPCESC